MVSQNRSEPSIPAHSPANLYIVGVAALLYRATYSKEKLLTMISWTRTTAAATARTELTMSKADINGSGEDIDISIRNTGQTALADFSWWDVLIQYYDTANNKNLNAVWLTSTSTPPVSGEWAVQGIYLDAANATAEVYEPNILNPGEEIIIRTTISPAIPAQTNNQVIIATPNGIRLTAPFTR